MKIEILTTGDELLEGVSQDTHSSYIGREIHLLGATVQRFNTVRDSLKELKGIILEISNRADVCVMTGGLGPTSDDLTLEALASAAQVDLREDYDLWLKIKALHPKVSQATQSNRRQARVPVGGEALLNEVGTAPGMKFKIQGCTFFAYPGVPHELRWHLNHSFLPWLKEQLGIGQEKAQVILRFCLIAEAQLQHLINSLPLPKEVRVGYQAMYTEHRVKLNAPNWVTVQQAVDLIQASNSDHYLNDQDHSISESLLDICRRQGVTLSFAESCTGGSVSAEITQVSGASSVFMGSVISYSNHVKHKQLGVTEHTLKHFGAVSAECAKEMAHGVRDRLETDWAASITGIAGPEGGSENKPVGTIFFSWVGPDISIVEKKLLKGDRAKVQKYATTYVLFKLFKLLKSKDDIKR